MTTIFHIPDVCWMHCFGQLSMQDFVSIRQSCRYFFKLTHHDNKNHQATLNSYWKMQSNLVSNDIPAGYNPKQWYQFYVELMYYLRQIGHTKSEIIRKINSNEYFQLQANDTEKRKYGSDSYDIDSQLTPLLKACKYDCVEMIKMFLSSGTKPDVNKRVFVCSSELDDNRETALTIAINKNSKKAIAYLLSLPEINIFCVSGDMVYEYTPLMLAAAKNNTELAKQLLSHPKMTLKNINSFNAIGESALSIACTNKHKDVALLLIDHGAEMHRRYTRDGVTLLFIAALYGLDWLANMLINSQTDENYVDQCEPRFNSMPTLLMAAAENGHLGMVKILLHNGCNNAFESRWKGETAFMLAAQHGHAEIVNYIYNFLNENIKNKSCSLGLYDKTTVAEYINRKNDDGNDAYMLAKKSSNDKSIDKIKIQATIKVLSQIYANNFECM